MTSFQPAGMCPCTMSVKTVSVKLPASAPVKTRLSAMC